MAPWLAKKLVARAAHRLPSGLEERYQEEWTAEIDAMGSGAGIGPLVLAVLWYRKSRQMAEIASQAPTGPDPSMVHQYPSFGGGLLGAATTLFSEQGINAVSVDRIIAAADVAPMTLYRRFGGKDDLVAASLDRWSEQWIKALGEQVERYGHPRARYAGLWEVLEQWCADSNFHGSFIANAALELHGRRDHPAQQIIAAHRRAEREFLEELAQEAGAGNPAGCAAQLQVLLHGTIQAATVDHRPEAARDARELAMTLL
jgi:AcrR family transcriptional regulator